MKASAKASKLPLRLLLLYVLWVCATPSLVFWSDFGNIEESIADWNWILGWSLILSVPLFVAGIIAALNFRRIWILASVYMAFAVFHIYTTTELYFSSGFIDEPSEYALDPIGFLQGMVIFAVPLLAIYLAWRFWPRRKIAA